MRVQLTKEGRAVVNGILKLLPGAAKVVAGFIGLMIVLSVLRSCVLDMEQPVVYQQRYHPVVQNRVSPSTQQFASKQEPFSLTPARPPAAPEEPPKSLSEQYPNLFPPDPSKWPRQYSDNSPRGSYQGRRSSPNNGDNSGSDQYQTYQNPPVYSTPHPRSMQGHVSRRSYRVPPSDTQDQSDNSQAPTVQYR